MGNGAAIGMSLVGAGLNVWADIRRKRYIDSERNRLMAMKIIEGIDIPENLSSKHSMTLNQEINKFFDGLVNMSMTHKGLKTNWCTSEELSLVQFQAKQLGNVIATIKSNDAEFKKQVEFARAHPDKVDQPRFNTKMEVYEKSEGLVKPDLISAPAVNLAEFREALQKSINPIVDESDPRYKILRRGNDVDKRIFYEKAVQDQGLRKGLIDEMLNTNSVTYTDLAKFAQESKAPEPIKRAFYDTLKAALSTGINDSLREDPIVHDYAVKWGRQHFMPTLFQDEVHPQYVKPKETKEPEEIKLSYDVYSELPLPDNTKGIVIKFKKPSPIPINLR